MSLADDLRAFLSHVPVRAWRFSLDTPGVAATVPMLRGVWGAALRELAPASYQAVFEGGAEPSRAVPGYVLRPVPPQPGERTAVEWLLFGAGAIAHESELLRAWDIASGMGLGPDRQRFFLRRRLRLDPAARPLPEEGGAVPPPWSLGAVPWPGPGDPASTPAILAFDVPLRLLRQHILIDQPGLGDIVEYGLRRVAAFAPPPLPPDLAAACRAAARDAPRLPWRGERLDFQRYSGRQKQEIDLRGVTGHLVLPAGPGPLWPLLAALAWCHLGKGAVFGLGQPVVKPGHGQSGIPPIPLSA